MWYTVIAVLMLISLFIGYKTTLSMDAHLEKEEKASSKKK